MKPIFKELLVYNRDGLEEQVHCGLILHINKEGEVLFKFGDNNDYPFYLRSCAKPLQASLMIDYDMPSKFGMTSEEIALCCASHAGEKIHTDIAKNLLNKIGISKNCLKCGEHLPISQSEQKNLLLAGEKSSVLHNNCSGKHIMMLGLCKINGWNISDYDSQTHPLQVEIKNKINNLCSVFENYPVTTDGCGVPIFSMPLKNMLLGYLNLFCGDKYKILTNTFLNNPYIIGGENRTDTKIIENSDGLVAKVGAGGLCIVVNTVLKEAFVVKIADCDMKAREIIVLEYLKKLGWADIYVDKSIKTISGKTVGQIEVRF